MKKLNLAQNFKMIVFSKDRRKQKQNKKMKMMKKFMYLGVKKNEDDEEVYVFRSEITKERRHQMSSHFRTNSHDCQSRSFTF